MKEDEKENEKRVDLTVRMMLGVRVAVGRQANESPDLDEDDFTQARMETEREIGKRGPGGGGGHTESGYCTIIFETTAITKNAILS